MNTASGISNTKTLTTQQRTNSGGGKSSNGNGNGGGNHEKNRRFGGDISKPGKGKGDRDGLEKDGSRRNDDCDFCNEKRH